MSIRQIIVQSIEIIGIKYGNEGGPTPADVLEGINFNP